MHTVTAGFTAVDGWSRDLPVELDSDHTLVLAFGAASFADHPEALRELSEAFPRARKLGCSTGGEILGAGVHDESLSVAVARFGGARLRAAAIESGAESSREAGQALAAQLAGPSLRLVFVLADGIDINGSDLVAGLNETLPNECIVTGGLAADGDRFEKTWVYQGDGPQTGWTAAVGFYGESLKVGHGSKGGWDIFGPERLVTRSDGRVLYELDGRPALELYKTYLGDLASGLPATGLLYPLALRPNDGSGSENSQQQVVRTILGVNEEDQSMTFAGEIPEGVLAQLMKANFDRIIGGAQQAALMTRRGNPDLVDGLAIAVSCVGRRWLLGERIEEELERTLDVLPEGTHQVGYYSYGEISPVTVGSCELHNQTMTLTTIAER